VPKKCGKELNNWQSLDKQKAAHDCLLAPASLYLKRSTLLELHRKFVEVIRQNIKIINNRKFNKKSKSITGKNGLEVCRLVSIDIEKQGR
jgi:hypothetical protein